MTHPETGIDDVILRELRQFTDARGWLAEIYRADEHDHQPAMAYISQTRPGVVRGPHEHKLQTDLFIFAGPGAFTVYLYDNRPESPTHAASFRVTVGASRPAMLVVPPRIIHAYRATSDFDSMVLNLPDKLYGGSGRAEEVDEVRHEDDPASPFYTCFDRSIFIPSDEA